MIAAKYCHLLERKVKRTTCFVLISLDWAPANRRASSNQSRPPSEFLQLKKIIIVIEPLDCVRKYPMGEHANCSRDRTNQIFGLLGNIYFLPSIKMKHLNISFIFTFNLASVWLFYICPMCEFCYCTNFTFAQLMNQNLYHVFYNGYPDLSHR